GTGRPRACQAGPGRPKSGPTLLSTPSFFLSRRRPPNSPRAARAKPRPGPTPAVPARSRCGEHPPVWGQASLARKASGAQRERCAGTSATERIEMSRRADKVYEFVVACLVANVGTGPEQTLVSPGFVFQSTNL